MWSLAASSILGVGHFNVPPDVVVESRRLRAWSTVRTIVVPHGIAAVPRRSPISRASARRGILRQSRTAMVERADGREWFTERLISRIKADALGEPLVLLRRWCKS
jgi:hypothetical protein